MIMDEAFPSRFQPTPLSVSRLEASFDPALIATPERRLPSVVPLQNRASLSPVSEDDSNCGRVMKVHFDKNVAVHHISPECFDSAESLDEQFSMANCRTAELCRELDLSTLSDDEPISVVASDLRNLSHSSSNGPKARGSCAKRLTNVTHYADGNLKGGLVNQLNRSRNCSNRLHPSKLDRVVKIKETVASSSVGNTVHSKSHAGAKKVPSESGSHKLIVSPVEKSKTDSTAGQHVAEDVSRLATSSPCTELQCVLATPELNSTLRIGREIEQVKEQEFNLSNVLKEGINPKIKNRLTEKACSKLNAESDMFPCLIGIDVSETELMTRLAREQSNRPLTSETTHKEKAEDKISRIPDVLEFFTRDLHKETPSVSMVALPTLRLEPRAARLDHAFDLYRHILTWERL